MIALILVQSSCGGEAESEETKPTIKEGKVYYSLTYPYYTDEFMVVLLPDVMTMEFKNNVYKNTVSKGGLFTTTLISDCNNKELVLMLDFGSKKIYTKLDSVLIKDYLKNYPIPDLLSIPTSDSLGGLHCKKYQAVYEKLEDGYDCEIYTTDEIDIDGSNWCNPFSELPGVMLEYEVSQYGLVTRMKADSVSKVSVADDAFVVPGDFKEVSLEQMLFQMEEIFKQVIE
ncbi:hypothetical protein [Parvicella tangerina]|nr:hypothetical protein [Parvicella tangerina]